MFHETRGVSMPQPKPDSSKLGEKTPKMLSGARKTSPKYTGTDIEAFYAAQKESAAASREYAASRRKR
jgi:hypothetical protein